MRPEMAWIIVASHVRRTSTDLHLQRVSAGPTSKGTLPTTPPFVDGYFVDGYRERTQADAKTDERAVQRLAVFSYASLETAFTSEHFDLLRSP